VSGYSPRHRSCVAPCGFGLGSWSLNEKVLEGKPTLAAICVVTRATKSVMDFFAVPPFQDRWAERSQKRFSAAQSAGKFTAEIAAVEIASRKGPMKFEKDEHNRPDTTLESLSTLKPAFRKDGTITAGNAPGLNTGAAAMVVASRAWTDKKGLEPMARLVAYGIGAVEPGMFGLGPVPAVRQALDRAGWKTGDIQRIEICRPQAIRDRTLGCSLRWSPRLGLKMVLRRSSINTVVDRAIHRRSKI
jgi:hypothetical protein